MAAGRIRIPNLKEVEATLNSLIQFLEPSLPLVNSHLNSFFVDSLWETVPQKLKLELENVSVQELKERMQTLTVHSHSDEHGPELPHTTEYGQETTLDELVGSIKTLLLRNTGMSIPAADVLRELHNKSGSELFDKEASNDLKRMQEDLWKINPALVMMSTKKAHEVKNMSEFVAKFSMFGYDEILSQGCSSNRERFNVKHLIDVGSGKGYLSSILTLLHEFKVLAIDSCAVNTYGCERRTDLMKKQLPSFIERTQNPDFESSAFRRRGKNWKSKTKAASIDSGESEGAAGVTEKLSLIDIVGEGTKTSKSIVNENLKTITLFVGEQLHYDQLLESNFSDYRKENSVSQFGLIGLHTCGQLGADSLKIFCGALNAKFIINVPCCIHLVHESYCVPEFKNRLIPSIEDFLPGFPMSTFLNERQFALGRNARMMSSQSVHRICSEIDDTRHAKALLHRSLLGLIFLEHTGHVHVERSVGRIGAKYPVFLEYVRKALTKVHLDHLEISDADILRIYDQYSPLEDKLCKYVLLRGMFAPLVEGLVLLDRLAYLLEQKEVRNACILELFDPFISPRCHAIVAVK